MSQTVKLTAALLLSTATIAAAQDGTQYNNSYTLGVVLTPEFEGSDDYQAAPLLGFRVEREHRWIELQGLSLRANILNSPTFEAGPVLNYRLGRDDSVENAFVASMPGIDAANELGLFAAYEMPVGQGGFRFAAEMLSDVSDVHDGWLGTVSAGYGAQVGNGWTVGTTLSATAVSDEYAATYFSTGDFAANGGWKNAGIDLSVGYALNDRSSLTGFVGYRRLLGDAADSPITQSGSEDQLTVGFGFTRKF